MTPVHCSTSKFPVVLLFVLIFTSGSQNCHGFRTFGFDIHHRFSDPVKGIIPVDELPEKGSPDYYAALAHRDQIFRGRGLADTGDEIFTFAGGNRTFRLASLGLYAFLISFYFPSSVMNCPTHLNLLLISQVNPQFLHYANVSLGTPSLSFLVALDTGSNLFWVPCDCTSCIQGLKFSSGAFDWFEASQSEISLILSPLTSACNLIISLSLRSCGQVQTGTFLDGAAPNGLFGLGIDKVSVPSILANRGLVADSFSMCFGPDGIGRISFGDKGSPDQEETPFNLNQLHPTYNISLTQIAVEKNVTDINFSAIFDSGTSFTYLNDPAYTLLAESFTSQAQDKRRPSDDSIPFEYCYDPSPNANSNVIPTINLTMQGGSQFSVYKPIMNISSQNESFYCLAVVKSSDVDIIGQNFMTGYRIVFDREKKVLGWKISHCYDIENSSTLPVAPAMPTGPAVGPGSYTPEATKTGNGSVISGAPPPSMSHVMRLTPFNYNLVMLTLPYLSIVLPFFLQAI
ncbi:hypothetical protein HHK36_031527 [Tetracentron sinense]|uniref:Peptidase A1 domain-containing protein n=1 Tax=Tetracentron sinense TaxID=13715 RepID=A0A834YB68_TETSI|nr:hypothetical protein HHK36_031527 [Tetracentron sinense]